MPNMNKEEKQIEEHRKDHEKFLLWKGRADGLEIVEFSKPLVALGFTTEQITTLWINKETIVLSENLKEMEVEIEKIRARLPEEQCNCPECTLERESSEL